MWTGAYSSIAAGNCAQSSFRAQVGEQTLYCEYGESVVWAEDEICGAAGCKLGGNILQVSGTVFQHFDR